MRIQSFAFTDLEFSGLDPLRHEIIEIGLVVADANTLEEKTRWETKVIPEHIENADPEALRIAGYKSEYWQNALPLKEALEKYLEFADDSMFAAWNSPYDWIFLTEAFKKAGLSHSFGHHTIDIFTVAFEKLSAREDLKKIDLKRVSDFFGIAEDSYPHRAINGASCAYEVYKKLKTF